MRLLICAGGTGGGVYPALAVLQALTDDGPDNRDETMLQSLSTSKDSALERSVVWVGSEGGMEEGLVKRSGVPFRAIPAAGVHGVGFRALPGNLLQLGRGYRKSLEIIKSYRPNVLFFTGGYVAVPMALAGRRIPSVLYVPDIEPGLSLKFLARFCDRVTATAHETKAYFPEGTDITVTGYPTRSELTGWDKGSAQKALGLVPDLPTLLVFGGSRGARSINRALIAALPGLLVDTQVIHISGTLDWQEVEAARDALSIRLANPSFADRYMAFPYLYERMGAAFAAADLVLSRAGASVLGEFPTFGLPAILVPYPHAWRYQQVNAQYLSQRGAAVIVDDGELTDKLLNTVQDLMRDSEKRERMSDAMRSQANPDAARSISKILHSMVSEQGRERI